MIFRRIHGRIVPINQESKPKAIAKGVGGIAAGIGVAGAAGHVAARMTEHAIVQDKISKFARKVADKVAPKVGEQLDLFKVHNIGAAKNFYESAHYHQVRAQTTLKAIKYLRRGGEVAGGALIAAGTNKILNQTRYKDRPGARAAISTGAGVAAAFAVEQMYQNSMGRKTFSSAAKAGMGDILKKIVRRL